jgi:anti-sigma-K factor RskA
MNRCDQLKELLPAYSIGTTNEEETRLVEALLEACPEYREELELYAALASGMAQTVTPVAPPAHVRSQLLSALPSDNHSQPKAGTSVSKATTITSRNAFWWSLAATAALLMIASNVLWAQYSSGLQLELDGFRQQQDALAAMLTDTSNQRIDLRFQNEQAPQAALFWNQRTNQGMLSTDNLPPLGDDQTYQLWLIGDEGPVSAGIFQPSPLGRELFTFQPSQPISFYAAVGISVEPAGGSDAPSSDPIAVGEVAVAQT